MKISRWKFTIFDFSDLDQQITKLKELRDSYRAANIEHYGAQLAALLND